MDNDLISRSELKKAITEWFVNERYYHPLEKPQNMDEVVAIGIVNNAPAVTPDKIQALMSDYLIYRCEPERPHGKWIKWNFRTVGPLDDWDYKCSNCEKVYYGEYNFCPNCGADMRQNNEPDRQITIEEYMQSLKGEN